MRRLRRFWNFITRPIRALRVRRPPPEEAPDHSIIDALSIGLQHPESILPHLDELRSRILKSLIALALATLVSFAFAGRLIEWLTRPIGGMAGMQAIEVTEPLGVFMRVALLSGVALAMPVIIFQAFRFVSPGLRRRERRAVLFVVPAATLLFFSGLAFAYFVMLPAALPFLINFMGIPTRPRPASYITFVTGLMFWIGVAFQIPLVIYALAALGVVKWRALAENWRFAVIAIAILAAAVTPTIDPVNMGLVMLPMITLYVFSILLAAIAQRGRERRRGG